MSSYCIITQMPTIEISMANELTVPRTALPDGVEGAIRGHLSIANGAKKKATKMKQYGAEEMPDYIDLWRIDGDQLVMPRGYAHTLRGGLERLGHTVSWKDGTVAPQLPIRLLSEMPAIPSADRPYQPRAVEEILELRQAVFQAPTAAGKTMIGLEAFRRAGTRALVLCDKLTLAEQWIDRTRKYLKIEPGQIQGPQETWTYGALTIGMVPTINRSIQRTGYPLPEWFGMVIADEVHHGIAETWERVITWFHSRYLLGFTATPLDGDWRRPMLEAMIGPVVQATDKKELRRLNVISQPEVQVVKTNYAWRPQGRDRALRDSRTIYKRIVDDLITDPERNKLIIDKILSDPDAAHLINSKRKVHLQSLRDMAIESGFYEPRVWMLTGDEDEYDKRQIMAAADEAHCLMLSTLAGEALDIPRLDRLHMAWPMRGQLPVTQVIGRVERVHPEKKRVIIYDYADFEQSVLRDQFFARLKIYHENGYRISGMLRPGERQ